MSNGLHGGLHGHDEAVGGGAALDRYSPAYIVGNEPAGDTAAVCHFLDPGDGSGIAAMIAAMAIAPGNAVIRRGYYDLNLAGSPTAPFAIPAGCVVECAGGSIFGFTGTPGVYIQARSAGDQGVWVLGEGAVLRDCAIGVPLPTAATSGSIAVVDAPQVAYAQIHNVAVQFQGALDAGAAANLTLRRAFSTTTPLTKTVPWLGVDYRNCYAQAVDGWSLRGAGVAEDFLGFFNAGFAEGLVSMDRGSQYDECSTYWLDIGILCFQTRCGVRQPNLLYSVTEGFQFWASECKSYGGQIVGLGPGAAILIASGTLRRAKIIGLLVNAVGGFPATCIRVVADTGLTITDCQILDCSVVDGTIGLLLDPNGGTVDYTVVGDNVLRGNTTPFSDLATNTVDTGNSV